MPRLSTTICSLFSLSLMFSVACSPQPEPPEDAESGKEPDTDGNEDTDTSSDLGPPADETCEPTDLPEVATEPVAGDHTFDESVHVTQAPHEDDTYYVVQRHGKIVVVKDGEVRDEPFLDLRDEVITQFPNRGLLGLAFHPNYEENGRFFVSYTSSGVLRNVVAEYNVGDGDPYRADPEEVRRLVAPKDPRKEHNGGTLQFGPEGYLYATLGNGGAGEWKVGPAGQAQDLSTVFGTVMRLDVDNESGNFAAPDNPFVDREEADPRIWVYGLRNPWRISIDDETGNAFIADVGRRKREEVNFVPGDSGGGQNFGAPGWEGTVDGRRPEAQSEIDDHTEPIFDYQRDSQDGIFPRGTVSIGGAVYRGDALPKLRGYYIHTDHHTTVAAAMLYCDGDDDGAREIVDHRRVSSDLPSKPRGIVAGNDDELLVVGKQKVEQIVPAE